MMQRVLFFLFFCFFALPATVFSAEDPARTLVDDARKKQILQDLEKGSLSVNTNIPVDTPGKSALCFPIHHIDIQGVSLFSTVQIAELVRSQKTSCMGQNEIKALIAKITAHYRLHGFITVQLMVPPQNLKSKILRILVVEGKIEKITHHLLSPEGKSQLAPPRKTKTAFGSLVGNPLNLRELEQGIAQINRNISRQARLDIAPGSSLGMSLLDVYEQEVSLPHWSVGFDNYGTGLSKRVNVSGVWEDVFSLNEKLTLNYLGGAYENAIVAGFSIPYGRWTLEGRASFSEKSTLLSEFSDLLTENLGAFISLSNLLYRDHEWVVKFSQSIDMTRIRRFIGAALLTPQYDVKGRSAINFEGYFPNFRIFLDSGFVVGSLILEDRASSPQDGRIYLKADGSATILYPFRNWFSVVGSLSYQLSPFRLPGDQTFNIGGWSSVRGTSRLDFSGDTGFLGRFEIQKSLFSVPPVVLSNLKIPIGARIMDRLIQDCTLYGFFDGGGVHPNGTQTFESLFSTGGGVRISGSRLTLDGGVAIPLKGGGLKHGAVEAAFSLSYRL